MHVIPLIPHNPAQVGAELVRPKKEKKIVKNVFEVPLFFSFLDLKHLSRCFLVNKKWKHLASSNLLWKSVFERTNFVFLRTYNSFISEAWKYRDLSMNFARANQFGAAIAACQKCAELSSINGAQGFKDLCEKACRIKDYKTAVECAQLAESCHPDVGSQAINIFIKTQLIEVTEIQFLKNVNNLIDMSVDLVDKDREFGLDALISVAKKMADFKNLEVAIRYTVRAEALKKEKKCKRQRNEEQDVNPFFEMAQHMLTLKEYGFAESCAKQSKHKLIDSLLTEIVIKQLEEEEIFNEGLLKQLKPGTIYWITAYERAALGLIDHKKFRKANEMLKIRFSAEKICNTRPFRYELKQKLKELNFLERRVVTRDI